MNDRKKRGAAGLLLLLGFGVYFAFRGGTPRPPPEPLAGASPTPTAAPSAVETAPIEAAPVASEEPSASASAAEDSASRSDDARARVATGVAPARHVTVSKGAEPAPPVTAKLADAGAPPVASATAVVAAAPIYPALVGQFMNRVGPQYRLLRVTCSLDGQTVYSGGGGAVIEMFRKMPPAGDHTVAVVAEYQGNGGGVFSYFDGYKFSVKAGHSFATKADAPTQVTIAAVEKGGPTTPFQERLSLRVGVR